jgi:hypothetical protein
MFLLKSRVRRGERRTDGAQTRLEFCCQTDQVDNQSATDHPEDHTNFHKCASIPVSATLSRNPMACDTDALHSAFGVGR